MNISTGPLPDTGNFIDTAMTLGFPPLTEAEKQKAVLRAAQDLAYEAAASLRVQENAAERKARRTRLRLQAVVAGGFTFKAPWILPFDIDHCYDSKRAERRRAKLGRA